MLRKPRQILNQNLHDLSLKGSNVKEKSVLNDTSSRELNFTLMSVPCVHQMIHENYIVRCGIPHLVIIDLKSVQYFLKIIFRLETNILYLIRQRRNVFLEKGLARIQIMCNGYLHCFQSLD